jgi:hypothetical protein
MTKPTPDTSPNSEAPLRIVLVSEESVGQIVVDLPAYVDFNKQFNERLEQLEQQFAAFRTPGMPTGRGKFAQT